MVKLREYKKEDIPFLVSYLNDKETTRYLTSSIPQPYSIADAEFWVQTGSKRGIVKAIEYNGIYVGDIGVFKGSFERSRSAEIGYWVSRKYWSRGIATKAVSIMSNLVFETSDIVRLYSQVFHENLPSCKVLEKNNFVKEAVLEKAAYKNDKFINTYLYAKIKI